MSRKHHIFSILLSVLCIPVMMAETQDTVVVREIEGAEIRAGRLTNQRIISTISARYLPSVSNSIEALIMTLPGVVSSNELSLQYSVRGGNFDENLVYVNGIEIFRPFLVRSGEQEGLSFINPNMVSTVQFSAGGFDARYGDKMSSVLDVRYRRPTEFAGSFSLDLLGASAHLEGATRNQRLRGMIGARHMSNQYLLNTLPTQGDYRPAFTDVQTYILYSPNSRWDFDFLGNIALNRYEFVPSSRQSRFGTHDSPMGLFIHFQGQEVSQFNSVFGAFSTSFSPNVNVQHRLIVSGFQTVEREFFDILGAYRLGEIGLGESTEPANLMGVGAFLNHARNDLNAIIYNVGYQGRLMRDRVFLLWGVRFQREDILDHLNEWTMVDSMGFSLPHPQLPLDSLGFANPARPPMLQNVFRAEHHLISNRYSGFFQANFEVSDALAVVAGVRFSYWNFNNQFLVSPRASLTFAPRNLENWTFRFATGVFHQPPFYREMRDLDGNLNPNIRAQRAIHVVGGADYFLRLWNRPFRLTSEVYYKALNNLIPFEIDNVRIRYLAQNIARGYAMGVDFRLAGEVVEGAESWLSVSFMRTRESINGGALIPRPTDQRVNFNLFFQDYLRGSQSLRAHLNLVFGTGVPTNPPDALRQVALGNFEAIQHRGNFRLPPYRRVDLGLSYHIRAVQFARLWLSAEVFNLFDMNNTISYLWISDFSGTQYAVANHLTSRRLNFRVNIRF